MTAREEYLRAVTALTPDEVKQYLASRGWRLREETILGATIWTHGAGVQEAEVLVPRERRALAGEDARDPGVLVRVGPQGDADAFGDGHARLGDGAVVLGLLGEFGVVGGEFHADVEFGDGDIESEVGEPLDVLLHGVGDLADDQVSLEAA